MGFKDVMNFEMKHDPITGGAKPHLRPDEKERLIKMQEEIKKDINDPEFHFEGDSIDGNESLDYPRNQSENLLFTKIKKQKEIDDKKIRLVYSALEKGIPLEDDNLYRDLLALYPYY